MAETARIRWVFQRVRLGNGATVLIRHNGGGDFSIGVPPDALEYIQELRRKHENYADLNLAELILRLFGEEAQEAPPI